MKKIEMRVVSVPSALNIHVHSSIVISFGYIFDHFGEGGQGRDGSLGGLIDLGDVSRMEFVATIALLEFDKGLYHLVLVFSEGN